MMSISDRNRGSNPQSSDCPVRLVTVGVVMQGALASLKLFTKVLKCGTHSPETSILPKVRKIAFPGTAYLCAILLQGNITHRICRKFVALGFDLSP